MSYIGTRRIISGLLGYKPSGGTGGQVHDVPFTITDSGGKSSTSFVRVTVAGAPPPPTGELPVPANPRARSAANYDDLIAAFNTAAPGDIITLTNTAVGAYAGADRTTVTLNGTSTDPIIVRGVVNGRACGVMADCPTIPFAIENTSSGHDGLRGHDVYFYGINFRRPDTKTDNGWTIIMKEDTRRIVFRRCWWYRNRGSLLKVGGANHRIDFCDGSVWGRQEIPTTNGLAPARPAVIGRAGSNWLPRVGGTEEEPVGPDFHGWLDFGQESSDVVAFRNHIHDCPFKMEYTNAAGDTVKDYHYYGITGFGMGNNPSEALEVSRWLTQSNLVMRAGHMDFANKTSENCWLDNTIDGALNKVDFNQRSGNRNVYIGNWIEAGSYSPAMACHGGNHIFISNRVPPGKKIYTVAANRAYNYDYITRPAGDDGTRSHAAYNCTFWGNTAEIRDGEGGGPVAASFTKLVRSDGQTYVNVDATNANLNAAAPDGYALAPGGPRKLTPADVGPGAAWKTPPTYRYPIPNAYDRT